MSYELSVETMLLRDFKNISFHVLSSRALAKDLLGGEKRELRILNCRIKNGYYVTSC